MDRSSHLTHVDVPSVLWAGGTAFTSYLCRVSLASVSRSLMRSLSISERQYGLLSGAFYLPYMLFMMPSTFCAQRWGSTWMGVSVVVWGFISCLPVLAGGSFAWFFAIRMGLGVVQSGTFPSIMEYLRGFHSPTRMGTAYGIAASGVMVAEIASPLIVGCIDWVAGGRSGGVLGLAAWQWVFLVDGAATVVFGLLFLVAGAKTVAGTTATTTTAATATATAKSPFQGGRSSAPAFDPWIRVVKDWRAWYLALVFLLVDQVITGWIFFAPLIVSSFFGDGGNNDGDDLSILSILLSAVPFVAMILGNWLVAWSSDRAGERRWHAAGSLGSASVVLFVLSFVGDVSGKATNSVVSFVLLTLGAGLTNGFHGPVTTWPQDFAGGAQSTRMFAFCNAWGCVGAFFGPAILGFMKNDSEGYRTTFLYNSVVVGLAGVLVALFRPGERRAKREGTHRYEALELANRARQQEDDGDDGDDGDVDDVDDVDDETAAILTASSVLGSSLSRRMSSRQRNERKKLSVRQLSV